MHEPLGEVPLADEAGLDLATVRRYLQDFSPYLPSTGGGRVKRWAAESVRMLQLIHRLYADGHTTSEIHHMLEGLYGDLPAAPPPISDVAPPPARRRQGPGFDFEAEIAALRERLYGPQAVTPEQGRAGPSAPEPAPPRPWWAFWRR
jgi:hypothetical protein